MKLINNGLATIGSKMIAFVISISVIAMPCSCYSSNRDQQALEVMRRALQALNENDMQKFCQTFDENTHGRDNIEQIGIDVKKVYYFLTKYYDNDIDSLYWTTDHKVDMSNKVDYVIELYNGFDSLSGYKKATLHFYFWNFDRIDALGGYRLEIEVDAEYRGKLLKAGRLPSTDELVQSLIKQ